VPRISPYLGFRDDAREALGFYHSVLGGQLTLSTFAEFGTGAGTPVGDLVMHGQLETDDGLVLQGADTPPEMQYEDGARVTVSLFGSADEADSLRERFAGLSEGGTVWQPLDTAPWGDEFGMFEDRFGIRWMVNVQGRRDQ